MKTMIAVALISRHRQWRAWQFARRHSRGFLSDNLSSSDNGMDPKTEKWFLIVFGSYIVLMLLFVFIWPMAAAYMMTVLIWLGILGWILKIFF